MTIDKSNNVPQWDAIKLLGIINPDNLSFCCVGYAPSQGRRCRNAIAQHNREAAMSVLVSIPKLVHDGGLLQQGLSYLAGLALCRRYHQSQAEDVTKQWCAIIKADLNNTLGSKKTQGAKMRRPDRPSEERAEVFEQQEAMKCERQTSIPSSQSAFGRRSKYQENFEHARQKADKDAALQHAKIQRRQEAQRQEAQRQREEREAAQAQQEEHEAESRRQAKREQDTRQREQRQKQENQERSKQEKRAWAASWAKYEDEWAQILRLKAMASAAVRPRLLYSSIEPVERMNGSVPGLHPTKWHQIARYIWPEHHPRCLARSEDPEATIAPIRDILPWPVRDGTWQEVNERHVKEFFQHALVNTQQNARASIKVLRAQSLRWHPDRMLHLLGTKASDDVMSRVTLVAQVLNGMVVKVREVDTSRDP